jgi:hypothetical protein
MANGQTICVLSITTEPRITMSTNLEALVEQTIDSTIRNIDPGDPKSYEKWVAELDRLEAALCKAEGLLNRLELLAMVRSTRIFLASDLEETDFVLGRSAEFLRDFPASTPSYFNVAFHRLQALHVAGEHENEIREALEIIRLPEIVGSEFLFLLDAWRVRHPNTIPEAADILAKTQAAIVNFREHGYEGLLDIDSSSRFEETLEALVERIRSIYQAKADAVLASRRP